jgi:uncharacterized protein involved in outer membrane biogenesis
MRKALVWLLGLIAVVLVVVLVGPSVVDGNRFKPWIADAVEDATGRRVTIGGALSLAILPTPMLSVADLRLANVPGARVPDFVRIKALDVRLGIADLLTGTLRLQRLALIEPVITLEVLVDGRSSWRLGQDGDGPDGAGEPPVALALDRLTIENGVFRYVTPAGLVEQVTALNAEFSAPSIVSGPFRGNGTFTFRDRPGAFSAALDRLISGRDSTLSVDLEVAGARAEVDGDLRLVGGQPRFAGRLRGEGEDLRRVVADLGGPRTADAVPWLPVGPFSLDAKVTGSAARLALDDVSLWLGYIGAKGAAQLAVDETVRADMTLSVGRIDLDRLLAERGTVTPSPRPGPTSVARGTPSAAPVTLAIPPGLTGRFDLSVDAVIYRERVVQKVHLAALAGDGKLTFTDASAVLPGDSNFQVTGELAPADGKPRFVGGIEARSSGARALLDWIGAEVSRVPPGRLGILSASAEIAGTPDEVRVSNLVLEVDSSRLTGTATAAWIRRPAVEFELGLDRLDVDSYLPTVGAAPPMRTAQATPTPSGEAAPEGRPDTAAAGAEGPFAALKLLETFDANIVAKVGSLTVNQQQIKGLELTGRISDGAVRVERASVADFGGGSAQITGSLRQLSTDPVLDATFDLSAPDAVRALKALRITPPEAIAKAGAMSLQGTAKGPIKNLAIDTIVDAFAGKLRLAGTVSSLADVPAWDLRVEADYPDLRVVLDGLGIAAPAGELGRLALAGATRGTPQEASLDGEVTTGAGNMTVTGTVSDPVAESPGIDLTVIARQLRPQFFAALAPSPLTRDLIGGVEALDGRIVASGEMQSLAVTLDGVEARGFGGIVRVNGHISDATGDGRVELSGELAGLQPRLLAKSFADGPVRNALDQVTGLSGGFAATGSVTAPELELRNVLAEAFGGRLELAGRAANIIARPRMDMVLAARSLDTVGMIRLVQPDYDPRGPVGALGFDAKLAGDGSVIMIGDIEGTLGQSNFSGSIQADLGAPRPRLDIDLDLDQIDLDAFRPAATP